MLSRQVIAYYGLMRASESLPAAYGFAAGAAAPKENGLRWESRGSPIYSAGLCSRAASHTPVTRRVRVTVSSSSVLAFPPVSRVRRHIGSFEAAEFTHSQVHRNCYGPRAGWPSFRGRLHSSLRRRGHPQSASNMTTWINSQFPRPDFHRRVQRHYGLQDTGIPPLGAERVGEDLESLAVVAAEEAMNQVTDRMVAKIGRKIADAEPAGSSPRVRVRDLERQSLHAILENA